MSDDDPTIDHDPHEKTPSDRRFSRKVWLFWAVALPLLWLGFWSGDEPFNWPQIALGFGTGAILVMWLADTIPPNKPFKDVF